MPFGYPIEPNFDLGKEQRRNRLSWPFFGGTALCLLYLFTGRPFATEVFQGFVATSLFYGEKFYVQRRSAFGKLWLWKAFLATLPVHMLYLAAIFGLDRSYPQVMTKAVVFIPVLAIGFAVESIWMERLIDRFKPATTEPTSGPVTQP